MALVWDMCWPRGVASGRSLGILLPSHCVHGGLCGRGVRSPVQERSPGQRRVSRGRSGVLSGVWDWRASEPSALGLALWRPRHRFDERHALQGNLGHQSTPCLGRAHPGGIWLRDQRFSGRSNRVLLFNRVGVRRVHENRCCGLRSLCGHGSRIPALVSEKKKISHLRSGFEQDKEWSAAGGFCPRHSGR